MRVFLLLSVLLLAASCGAPRDIYSTDKNALQKAAPAPAPVAAPPAAPNSRSAILKPYFKEYMKRPVESDMNVFKNNLASFAPFVEVEAEPESAQEEPRTPLEYYDVESYRLVLIMSGTAQAKAMLTDPQTKSYIVQVGTKIGNRGGKVASISSTELRIEEPGRPVVIKALESGTEDMIRELQSVQEY
jgi:Tfp pilus assembly protein PilP